MGATLSGVSGSPPSFPSPESKHAPMFHLDKKTQRSLVYYEIGGLWGCGFKSVQFRTAAVRLMLFAPSQVLHALAFFTRTNLSLALNLHYTVHLMLLFIFVLSQYCPSKYLTVLSIQQCTYSISIIEGFPNGAPVAQK